MGNTPFGNFCSLKLVAITIALSLFFFGCGSLIFCNCFLTSFSSTSFSPPDCALFETVCSNVLKYLKSAMITLYRLLLECALERQSRTMKEIFDSICNARVSVHYKGFFLVNYRQSRRQGVKMAERNCVGCESITKCVCLKCDAFACNRSLNVQFQHLKFILVGKKLLCVLNAIKRNKLQIIIISLFILGLKLVVYKIKILK